MKLLVKEALDARKAGVVDTGVAHDVRRGRTLRVDAPLLGLELEAGNAETIDEVVLARTEAALDPDEGLVALELLPDLVVFQVGQGGDDLACGFLGIEQQTRIEEGRHHRHRRREHRSVSIDDIGAFGLDRSAARRHALGRLSAVAQQRDIAHAQADCDERQCENRRRDDEPLPSRLLGIALEAILR